MPQNVPADLKLGYANAEGTGAGTASAAEYLVEALGCPSELLRCHAALDGIVSSLVSDLALHPIGHPVWHTFPGAGGITGLVLLSESHIALHTFPETGVATFNLFCCRRRPAWPWADRLAKSLHARDVVVRVLNRGTLYP